MDLDGHHCHCCRVTFKYRISYYYIRDNNIIAEDLRTTNEKKKTNRENRTKTNCVCIGILYTFRPQLVVVAALISLTAFNANMEAGKYKKIIYKNIKLNELSIDGDGTKTVSGASAEDVFPSTPPSSAILL